MALQILAEEHQQKYNFADKLMLLCRAFSTAD